MKLAVMVLFFVLAMVYFIDFVVLFRNRGKWWRSLIISAICSVIVILTNTL